MPHQELHDVAGAGAQDLSNADLLRPPLGGEGGKAEEAEAADDDREHRECGEALRARILGLVELANDVLAELGLERNVAGDLLPLALDGGFRPSQGRRDSG